MHMTTPTKSIIGGPLRMLDQCSNGLAGCSMTVSTPSPKLMLDLSHPAGSTDQMHRRWIHDTNFLLGFLGCIVAQLMAINMTHDRISVVEFHKAHGPSLRGQNFVDALQGALCLDSLPCLLPIDENELCDCLLRPTNTNPLAYRQRFSRSLPADELALVLEPSKLVTNEINRVGDKYKQNGAELKLAPIASLLHSQVKKRVLGSLLEFATSHLASYHILFHLCECDFANAKQGLFNESDYARSCKLDMLGSFNTIIDDKVAHFLMNCSGYDKDGVHFECPFTFVFNLLWEHGFKTFEQDHKPEMFELVPALMCELDDLLAAINVDPMREPTVQFVRKFAKDLKRKHPCYYNKAYHWMFGCVRPRCPCCKRKCESSLK